MSKEILVMDMPSNCSKCDLRGKNYGLENVCFGKVEHSKKYGDYYKDIQNIETRPDWCPLKPMPEKKKERYGMNRQTSTGHWETYGEKIDSVAVGYNACIDEILGDKE